MALHLSTLYFQYLQPFSNKNGSPTNLLYSIWLFPIIVAFYTAIKSYLTKSTQGRKEAFCITVSECSPPGQKSWGTRLKQKTTLSHVRKQKAGDAGTREHLRFWAIQHLRTV